MAKKLAKCVCYNIGCSQSFYFSTQKNAREKVSAKREIQGGGVVALASSSLAVFFFSRSTIEESDTKNIQVLVRLLYYY